MLKMLRSSSLRRKASVVMTLTLVFGLVFQVLMGASGVKAANFDQVYVRYDRMAAGTTDPGILVVLTPTTADTEAQIDITFTSDFTVDATCTVSTTNLPSGVTALPTTSSLACSGNSGTYTVSITNVDDLTVGTDYGVNIVSGVDLPASAGSYEITVSTLTSGSATIDSSNVATRVITDDQIVITATVPPTFNFTLGGNTDSFTSDLDVSSVVSTTGVTATIETNASNGWVAFVRSANQGLDSSVTGDTIDTVGTVNGSPDTLSAGTEGYVLDVNVTTDSSTSGTGTVTIDGEYDGGANAGGTLSDTHQLIASANGPTDGDVITLVEKAAISGLTKAADDYTDTLTVVGAGNF